MSTDNQNISEKFVNGPALLAAWNASEAMRAEFLNDFDAYCHYAEAKAAGLIHNLGEK